MASENKLKEIIKTSLENIRTMIDANTVIGTPYTTPSGTTIIPVSNVSMGFATCGLDYSGKAESQPQNFGAGGGTGLSIQPLGFLVIAPDGSVEMVNIGLKNPSDPVEQLADLVDRSPEIIAKIKAIFKKKPAEEEEEEAAEAIETLEAADSAE